MVFFHISVFFSAFFADGACYFTETGIYVNVIVKIKQTKRYRPKGITHAEKIDRSCYDCRNLRDLQCYCPLAPATRKGEDQRNAGG